MLGAIKAASEGTGINRAALEFGVPKTTLKDRISGRVQHGSKSGRVPYLSGIVRSKSLWTISSLALR